MRERENQPDESWVTISVAIYQEITIEISSQYIHRNGGDSGPNAQRDSLPQLVT